MLLRHICRVRPWVVALHCPAQQPSRNQLFASMSKHVVDLATHVGWHTSGRARCSGLGESLHQQMHTWNKADSRAACRRFGNAGPPVTLLPAARSIQRRTAAPPFTVPVGCFQGLDQAAPRPCEPQQRRHRHLLESIWKRMVRAPVHEFAVRQQLGQLRWAANGSGTVRHAAAVSSCASRVRTSVSPLGHPATPHTLLGTPLASTQAATRISCASGEGADGRTGDRDAARRQPWPGYEMRFQEVAAAVAGYMRAEGKWPKVGTQLAGLDAGVWLLWLRSAVQDGTAAPARVDKLVDLASILSAEVPRHTWTMSTCDIAAAPSAATEQEFNAAVGQVALYKLLMGDLPRDQECLLGRPVGAWFCALRADLRLGDLSDSRLAAVNSAFQAVLGLDKFPDVEAALLIEAWAGVGAYNDLRWSRSLQAVCTFVSETGRQPSTTAEDDYERQLGIWVMNARAQLNKGPAYLSRAREERLDMTPGRKVWGSQREGYPHCCHVADLRHLDMCAAIGLISPSVVLGLTAKSWDSDLAPYCDGSGTGSGGIRIAGRTLPASVGAYNLKRARTFLGAAYALCAYVSEHGKPPSGWIQLQAQVQLVNRLCGESEEPVASCQVRNAAGHDGESEEPVASCQVRYAAGHDGGSEASVVSKLVAASAAVPYCSGCAEAADSAKNEIDLSSWLTRARKDAGNGNLGADRIAVLDAVVGHMVEWRVSVGASSRRIAWEQKLGHAVNFLHTQGRLPTEGECVEGSDGSHLVGRWLSNQRRRACTGKLVHSLRMELDERLPGWHLGGRTVC